MRLLCIALLALPLAAQMTVVGEGSGGGSSTLAGLTDVDIAGASQGSLIIKGASDWEDVAGLTVYITIELTDTEVGSTGDGKYYFPVDADLNGYVLTGVTLRNTGPGTTSGALTIDLARCTPGAAICSTEVDMLSTSVSVDYDEFSSSTAASAVAINTSNDDVATDQFIRVDVDAIAGGTAATGVTLGLTFTPGS